MGWSSNPLMAQTNGATIVKGEYYIDFDPGIGKAIDVPVTIGQNSSNTVDLDLGVSISTNFPVGLHTLYLRFQSSSNIWSVNRAFPFRVAGIVPIVDAEYFIDTDPGEGKGNRLEVINGANPIESLLISTIDLPTNISKETHTLFIRAKDAADRRIAGTGDG